jgi:hypothetical protein
MVEIKDTSKKDVKRLIIYTSEENFEQSFGIKLSKSELYSLFIELREIIKEIDETLINETEEV